MNEFESIYEPKEHLKYLEFKKDHNFYDYIEDSPRGAIALHSVNAAYQMYINRQDKIDAAINWVEENKKSIALSEWHGYTAEEYVDADDLLELLK